MTPVIFIINLFSRGVMRLMRVDPDAADKAMTEEELRTIVDVSHEDGVIESDEKEMIYNVFDLRCHSQGYHGSKSTCYLCRCGIHL